MAFSWLINGGYSLLKSPGMILQVAFAEHGLGFVWLFFQVIFLFIDFIEIPWDSSPLNAPHWFTFSKNHGQANPSGALAALEK